MEWITIIILAILFALVMYLLFRPTDPDASDSTMTIATHSTERLDPEDAADSLRSMFPNIGIMTFNQFNQINGTLLFKRNANAAPKYNMFVHTPNISNYHSQIIGRMFTTLYVDNAVLADERYFKLNITGEPLIYTGVQNSTLIALDVIDKVGPLRIYNYTKTYAGYEHSTSANAAYASFTHVANAGKRFIIMGDFNVSGGIWSQIADRVFGSSIIHSWVPGLITCDDYEGIASPDGIIISKSVATTARFGVRNITPATSLQHNVLYAELGGTGKYTDKESRLLFATTRAGIDLDYSTRIPEWSDDWIDITPLTPRDTSNAIPTIKLQDIFNPEY